MSIMYPYRSFGASLQTLGYVLEISVIVEQKLNAMIELGISSEPSTAYNSDPRSSYVKL